MNLPFQDNLDTVHLQRLFDNMSECYKLFWFQAIVEQVYAGKVLLSYNDLISNMIADAWYMVSEYRLNLGPADNLEDMVHYAKSLLGLKSSEKKSVIVEAIIDSSDKELVRRKQILTYNVPYRLQAPFLHNLKDVVGRAEPRIILFLKKKEKDNYNCNHIYCDFPSWRVKITFHHKNRNKKHYK